MATANEERLREIDARIAEIERISRIKEIDTRISQIEGRKQVGLTDLAQSFNTGLVDLINLPSEIINLPLGAVGAPEIPTEGFRQAVADTGLTAQPGEEAEGFLPTSARILGASVIPEAAVLKTGVGVVAGQASRLLSKAPDKAFGLLGKVTDKLGLAPKAAAVRSGVVPLTERTGLQHATAATAGAPAASSGITLASSIGAGGGGAVAKNFTDNPNMIILGELAGGFTTPLTTAALRIGGRSGITKLKRTLLPFTKAGATPRAAARLQGLSADPAADAARVDVTSKISPFRQTGNPRLIALEKTILEQNPQLEAKFHTELNGALNGARQQAADFGGENRIRDILQRGQNYLKGLLDLRVAKASAIAQNKIAAIGTDVSQRDISRIARTELDGAFKDARSTERQLWGAIDKKTPAGFENAKAAVVLLKSDESALVPTKIPSWLKKAVETESAVTFNDVLKVRGKALEEARAATQAGKFDKARVLNTIANGNEKSGVKGILDDMSAVNDPNVLAARDFSRQLNQKFTEGPVGALLSRGANRGAGIASADTLNKIFSGAAPGTNVRAFLAASPDSAPQVEQFMKSGFINRSTKGGKFNQTQAQNQIDKLESQGMFEIFPNMKNDLLGVGVAFKSASDITQRATTVAARGGPRLAHDSNRSLAGILLNSDPGGEINALLKAENPTQLAATLKRRMGTDKRAIAGLKSAFVETMFNNVSKTGASGEIEVSGKALTQILDQNMKVAKALGMDGADITRLRTIIREITQSQTKSGKAIGAIIEDKPGRFLSLFARIFGAQKIEQLVSGKAGLGSGLIAAKEGSKLAQDTLQTLTTAEAQKIVVDAASNPALFKKLMTFVDAEPKNLLEATQFIESWIIGSGVKARAEREQQDQ